MFNGDGDVPDVHGIQVWLERAWAAGFDIQGKQETLELAGTNSLLGSDIFIGESTRALRGGEVCTNNCLCVVFSDFSVVF